MEEVQTWRKWASRCLHGGQTPFLLYIISASGWGCITLKVTIWHHASQPGLLFYFFKFVFKIILKNQNYEKNSLNRWILREYTSVSRKKLTESARYSSMCLTTRLPHCFRFSFWGKNGVLCGPLEASLLGTLSCDKCTWAFSLPATICPFILPEHLGRQVLSPQNSSQPFLDHDSTQLAHSSQDLLKFRFTLTQ